MKFVDHPELHERGKSQSLVRQAEELLRSGDRGQPFDETMLFKALNACASTLSRTASSGSRLPNERRQRLQQLHQLLIEAIVEGNIGLVYDMVRRSRVAGIGRDDLVSEGLWTLFKSVTSFDPWRGFRFSTYACTSILRAFVVLARKQRRDQQVMTDLRERCDPVEPEQESAANGDFQVATEHLGAVLSRNDARLTELERFILERRVLHDPRTRPATLAQLGDMFKLSKERVRQVQLAALSKLEESLLAIRGGNPGSVHLLEQLAEGHKCHSDEKAA